ncbi:restriction endonuclease subunit S [Mesomycoplasma hyorhinis]|uniref:restriction endonuclease subunit S n=1 Tax=Mesomycoplasma hyorhinis TaxID=2100 RepID=UPI003B634EE0
MFELDGGGFVSKYEIQNNPGKYPVYSSQTTNNGTMGYISSYKYDLECLTWTTRGYAGVCLFFTKVIFQFVHHWTWWNEE